MSENTGKEGLSVIKGEDFEFVVHGISEKNQLIVLVYDDKFGACSYALSEHKSDDGVALEVDIITTGGVTIPVDRQETILNAVLFELIPSGEAKIIDFSDPVNIKAEKA